MFRDGAVPAQLTLDPVAQGARGVGFAVNQEGAPGRAFEMAQPGDDPVGIRMGGQHGQVGHFRFDTDSAAMDAHLVGAGHDGAPGVPGAWKPLNRIVLRRSGA